MEKNNIIFYICNISEKSAFTTSFQKCSAKEKKEISDILEKEFDNLSRYDAMSSCITHSSGWISDQDVHDIFKKYEDARELFHYESREDLLNHVSDIQGIFKA